MALAHEEEATARRDILRIGAFLHQKSLVAASDGNISVRLAGGRILATPTSMSKGLMESDDLVVTDLEGRKLEGKRNPSSEMAMHLLIYQLRPEVNGVVHAHPPAATGFAAAGIPLNQALLAEVVLALGCIPLAEYGTTGTPELSATLRPLIPHYDAILMANHGVVTYGEDAMKAYFKMETVEHFARIALVTHLLGRQNLLGQEEVGKLLEARQRYEGITTAAALGANCPVTREAVAGPARPLEFLPPPAAGKTLPNGKRRW
ncbi:MAG TPA: class II aldolase/adducin family protein [Terriglobales bacterium]|nr:class II aldolase/adducin family protein [Terriglobales bacterium]